jgi:hypothetical protein
LAPESTQDGLEQLEVFEIVSFILIFRICFLFSQFVFVEISNPFLASFSIFFSFFYFQSIRKPMPASTQHPSNLYGASSPVVVSTSPQPLKRYRCAPDAIPR